MWFIEFNIVLAIIVILFHQLLYKKGNIRWNRWILLALPFIFLVISYFKSKIGSFEGLPTVQYPTIMINYNQTMVTESIDWLSVVYVIGVSFTLLFFIFSLFTLIAKFKTLNAFERNSKYVIYQGEINTSFFNRIIIDKSLSRDQKELVLLHEKAHVNQLHSLDRVIVALIQCAFWFNPAIYLWGKMIVNNHEFLADEAVTQKESNENYTLFLINQKLNTKSINPYSLTSNMSNLKSRIMKMSEKRPTFMYTYLILPLVAVATISFTFNPNEGTVSKTSIVTQYDDPIEDPDVQPAFKGGNEAMMSFLQKEIKYPKKAMEEKTQGVVYVSMVINKQGEVTKVEALKSPSDLLKNEAERVVKKMPNWTPGEKNGTTVAVKVVLPISFKL